MHAIHAITVDELAHHNPALHFEYQTAVTQLIELIRSLVDKNNNLIQTTYLNECFDTNANEAYLDLAIGDGNNAWHIHVYLHSDNKKFMIGLNGNGTPVSTANQIIEIINSKINQLSWI